MTRKEIIKYLEDWAPKEIAWQNDNVGLQVGRSTAKLKNILLSLELTPEVVNQAIKKNCNLIITHHPLIFQPIRSLNLNSDLNTQLIEKLIKNDISLYSAHTNLDFTKHGVSFQLAKKLGLQNITFLKNLKSNQFKLSVFVPETHVEKVASAIFSAGGGVIGEYSNCSFRSIGEGTFKGSNYTNPKVGLKGKFEKVKEVKLEVIIDSWKLEVVLNAMRSAHPYEEPAHDIYPLENYNVNFGTGAVGYFEKELSLSDTLALISQKLRARNLRYVKGKKQIIKKVAVCGGSGSDLISDAIKNGADAFVTADIKYHAFHSAQNKILLIDAGHYETETPVLDEVQRRLKKLISEKNKIQILKFNGNTNPINFYNKMRSHVN
jgi:dinuclear metal center YbgI/SA1388 family protein